jgi:hypothetical protein
LWCSQSGNHPKNNLAKFGLPTRYESRKEMEPYPGTYHKNLAIRKKIFKKSSKSGKFESFLPWKILWYISWNHIFQVKIWRKFASKRNTEWSMGFNTRTTSLVCIIMFSIKSKYPIAGSGWYENLKMYPISSRPGWYESF